MKNIRNLLIAIFVSEFIGILGSVFTISALPKWYANLSKPPFTPPNWIFAPVWIILYLLMGIALYLVLETKNQNMHNKETKTLAVRVFGIQLFLNLLWSVLFFGLRSPTSGMLGIVALWIMVLFTIYYFSIISKKASLLLIPYILWITFAMMLNFWIMLFNP